MVNLDDNRSNSPNNNNSFTGQRRQSFSERMFGNARDWFQRSNSRDSSNGSPFGSPPNGSSFDSDNSSSGQIHGRPRSLSTSSSLAKSYWFNHHRDIIIPGPVF